MGGPGRLAQHSRRESPIMRKVLTTIALILGLSAFALTSANADHAQDWSANGDSFVVDETTVHLEGGNTSVETAALGINVNPGTEVSFTYALQDGALCEAGAPRVFLIVNGTNNKSEACDGTGLAETEGTISFVTGNAGLITGAGVVYDSGRPGHVLVSDLTIGGEVVHFTNPAPAPEVCEWDAELLADDELCVEPVDEDPVVEDPKDEDPVVEDEDTAPVAVPTSVPAGEELPKTGVNPVLAGLVGAGLLGAGGGLLAWQRRRVTS